MTNHMPDAVRLAMRTASALAMLQEVRGANPAAMRQRCPEQSTDGRTDELTDVNLQKSVFSRNASPANQTPESAPHHTTTTELAGPTWVYHCFCHHGAPRYVGIAYDVMRRLKQHRASKTWWPDLDSVIADLYPTRQQALAVETHYLTHGYDTGLHNIQGLYQPPPAPHRWLRRQDYRVGTTIEERGYYLDENQQMAWHPNGGRWAS